MVARRYESSRSNVLSTSDNFTKRHKVGAIEALQIQSELCDKSKRINRQVTQSRIFIRLVKKAMWLSPIVVLPKKNGKIRVCVNYYKLNATTVTNAFLLPFTDGVVDVVEGHEMHSFLDGFSGYNQVRMHPEDQEKMAFVT